MRAPRLALLLLLACSSAPTKPTQPAPPAPGTAGPAPAPAPAPGTQPPAPAPVTKERLAADTPKTTVAGNTFLAPAGWTIHVQGPATILEPPEGDSRIAL